MTSTATAAGRLGKPTLAGSPPSRADPRSSLFVGLRGRLFLLRTILPQDGGYVGLVVEHPQDVVDVPRRGAVDPQLGEHQAELLRLGLFQPVAQQVRRRLGGEAVRRVAPPAVREGNLGRV